MARKIGRLVHPGGKYMHEGVEKTRWTPVGALFQKEDGGYRVKLDAIPVNMSESDGWLQVFEDDDRPKQSASPKNDLDDDIPFK